MKGYVFLKNKAHKKIFSRFINLLTFIVVCFSLLACGSGTPSATAPTPKPTVTKQPTKIKQRTITNLGNIGPILGSSLDAFVQYFHRQPDDHDQPREGTRYEWIVPDVGPFGTSSAYDVTINKDGVVIDINIIFSHLVKYGVCAAYIPKDGKIQGAWKKEVLAQLFTIEAPNVMVAYQSNTLSKLPPEDFSASQTILQTNSKRGSATVETVMDAQLAVSHCDIYLQREAKGLSHH